MFSKKNRFLYVHSICVAAYVLLIALIISPKLLYFATKPHNSAFAHKNLLLGASFISISSEEDYSTLSDKDDKEMISGLESENLAESETAKSAGPVAHVPKKKT